jgi:small subunit ribosomal protein S17
MDQKAKIHRKRMQGVVTKLSSAKTIKVKVETVSRHPLYKKTIKSHKSYLVHCEDEAIKIKDKVMIEEGSPVSQHKSFYLVKKLG